MDYITRSVEIVKTLKQVAQSIKKKIGRPYKNMNLTVPQGMLVGTLAHHGKMKISELSEKLDLSNSTVSGIIDRLEKQGMVERTRCDDDRRVVYVDVTPEFKKSCEEQFKDIEKIIAERINNTDEKELTKIMDGLNALKKMLE